MVEHVLNMCFYFGQQLQNVRQLERESTTTRLASKYDHFVEDQLPPGLYLMFNALIAGWTTFDPAVQHSVDFIFPFPTDDIPDNISGRTSQDSIH